MRPIYIVLNRIYNLDITTSKKTIVYNQLLDKYFTFEV